MATPLKIDFVSDVSCPWCAIGLSALEQALDRVKGEVQAELHFQPFELNPQMGKEGQDVSEHLTQKYGSTPAQQEQIRNTIRERGAAVGLNSAARDVGASGTPLTRTACCIGPDWKARTSSTR
jgi:predicted DsbA family dithiol-disulfide isomerase